MVHMTWLFIILLDNYTIIIIIHAFFVFLCLILLINYLFKLKHIIIIIS